MALFNTNTHYGSLAKWLHWLISLTIITLLCVGFYMTSLPKDHAMRMTLYTGHKITGLVVLSLVCIRFIWTLINVKPALPGTPNVFEKFAERSVHWLFYLCMFAMPMSGWTMSCAAGYCPQVFGITLALPFIEKNKTLAENASCAHEVIAWTIIVLLSLHIAAALMHHYVKRDNVLKRMMPGSNKH